VAHLYWNVFNRCADEPGLLGWTQALYGQNPYTGLLTREAIVQGFMSSPEFTITYGARMNSYVANVNSSVMSQIRTDVFYDPGGNVVFHLSSGAVDFNTEYWYTLSLSSYLRKDGFVVDFDSAQSNGSSYVAAFGSATAVPGSYYDAITWADLVVTYQTYEVVYGCGLCYDWYDPFDYSFIERGGQPIDSGITFGAWVWLAPVIVARTASQTITLGNTGGAPSGIPGPRSVFNLKVKAFIRPPYIYGPDSCYAYWPGIGTIIQPTVYKGDGRGFDPWSFNVRAISSIMLSTAGYILPGTSYNYTGVSEQYAFDGLQNGALVADSVLNDCHLLNRRGRASTNDMHVAVSGTAPLVTANFYGSASDPVSSVSPHAPPTSWNITATVNTSNPLLPTYTLVYTHKCYPDFEVYEGGRPLYQFQASGNDPATLAYCLAGLGQISGIKAGSLF